jgi:hypothetical protein
VLLEQVHCEAISSSMGKVAALTKVHASFTTETILGAIGYKGNDTVGGSTNDTSSGTHHNGGNALSGGGLLILLRHKDGSLDKEPWRVADSVGP